MARVTPKAFARKRKNLSDLGRYLARRAKQADAREADAGNTPLDATGQAALNAILERRRAEVVDFELYADNLPALELWHELSGLWRYGAMGAFLGLDWAAAAAVLQLSGLTTTRETVAGCRVIESAFVAEYGRS
jgi:hypothetical protein